MKREEYLDLLNEYIENDYLIKHSLAVEAVMKALASRLEEDEDLWGTAGLLHDLDADITDYETEACKHGKKTVEILKEKNIGNDIIYDAILAHNKETGKSRDTLIEKAIYAADPITGFITAVTLVRPDKKIDSVKVKSVKKKVKDKTFSRAVSRDAMKSVEDIGIPFDEFIALSLEAMGGISEELGL